jgi:hypothetical protein
LIKKRGGWEQCFLLQINKKFLTSVT